MLGGGPRMTERRAAGDVIEDEHRPWGEEQRIGGRLRSPLRDRKALEPSGRAVRDRADEPARKRQGDGSVVREARGPRERGTEGMEKGGGRRGRRRVARRGWCDEANLFGIAESQEGISSETLAALHALQKEPRAQRGQLQERRDRRIEVGRDVERPEVHGSSAALETKGPPPSREVGRLESSLEKTLVRRHLPEARVPPPSVSDRVRH